jgi:aminoglycoside phosphotransferase (APT) family kinase protein
MHADSRRGIDAEAVTAWMVEHVPEVMAPLQIELAAGGHSNLTFCVTDASGHRFALRRPPLGDLPPGAHDVAREHRILTALQATAVPVPQVLGLCTDLTVTGAPFYIMAWVNGPILERVDQLAMLMPTVAMRRDASLALVETLANLHRVDVDAVGLGELGPRGGYLPRQLDRMYKVWNRTKTRELPIIDSLYERLRLACPPQAHTGLVHSDFRFGNVILAPSLRPAAVLDWELCALGDVLVDLGFLLANWDLPADPWPNVWMELPPTRGGGFPTRAELVKHYEAFTGWDISHIDYYRAFCLWRIAIIAEGIKRRYASGALGDKHADPDVLERRVRDRAALADEALSTSGKTAF